MSTEDKMSILCDEAGEESMKEGGVELGADGRRKPGQHKYLFFVYELFRLLCYVLSTQARTFPPHIMMPDVTVFFST